MKYQKGDTVWWWSGQGGKSKRSKAKFLRYDPDAWPDPSAILVIPIGTYKHTFRWPLKFMEKVR